MKDIHKRILAAVFIGIAVTFISAFNRDFGDLIQPCDNVSGIEVIDDLSETSSCIGMQYGYPFKFVVAKPMLSFTMNNPNDASTVRVGGSAMLGLKWPEMFMNILLWSGVGVVMLSIFDITKSSRAQAKSKR
jgi:hypothetical protein